MADEINKNDIKNTDNSSADQYYSVGSFIWEVVKVFFWALVIIAPIRIFLFQPFFVQGASMEPNFHDGDYLMINEIGYKKTDVGYGDWKLFSVETFREFERGDVVVFKYPKDPSKFFIKRIIALPGEKIEIKEGKIFIYNKDNPDGFELDEKTYLSSETKTLVDNDMNRNLTRKLEKDEYFVLGDNRSHSHDSRAWGTIRKSDVTGRAFLRAWPVQKAGLF